MALENIRLTLRGLLIILFLVNNAKQTYNQYYYIEGQRPVYILEEDEGLHSPTRSEEVIENESVSSSEKESHSSRSMEDFDSSEPVEVQYVQRGSPFPVNDEMEGSLSRKESGGSSEDSYEYESSESSEKKKPTVPSPLRSEEERKKGDPGKFPDHEREQLLPQPRIFLKWPVNFEYKEQWKAYREVRPKKVPQKHYSPIDPQFYDSKQYIKYLKKKRRRNKKSKKWSKLASLIQFKYMKYLKKLEGLAPDDAALWDSSSLVGLEVGEEDH